MTQSPHGEPLTQVVIIRSNPVSPDSRVEKTARALANEGYTVTVLGWDRTAGLPLVQERSGYRLQLYSLAARYGSGMGNLIPLLRWQMYLFFWLIKNRRSYTLIHACDFDTILPAFVVRALFKKKVVYDIFDFYADHLRNTPSILKEWIRRLDFWAINHTEAVILVDDARRGQISGAHPRQTVIIYNTPEDLVDRPTPIQTPSTSLRLAYIGLLQVERGLLEIIDVLAAHPEWTLDLAGFGGDEELILARAQPVPNIIWHGRVPYEKALELSAAADVLFATYDPAIPNHKYSSPNKVFEAMMLGKPVIVSAHTHMDELIEQEACGVVVPYGDIPELEQALVSLAQNPSRRVELGHNGRLAYETRYSWKIMQNRLIQLYGSL